MLKIRKTLNVEYIVYPKKYAFELEVKDDLRKKL